MDRVNSHPDPNEDATKIYYKELIDLTAGAGSGIFATVLTAPLDYVKTRLQNGSTSHRGDVVSHLANSYSCYGIRGCFRGLGPSVMGIGPTWAIYFWSYDKLKIMFTRSTQLSDSEVSLYAATLSGGLTQFATNPVWVLKVRIQTDERLVRMSYREVLSLLVREEGPSVFYRGLSAGMLGTLQYGIQFPIYEALTEALVGNRCGVMVAAGVSKVVSSFITYPHEVVRTRLQSQSIYGIEHHRGVLDATMYLYRRYGIRIFYNGMLTNLVRSVPANIITLCMYDILRVELYRYSRGV